MSELSLAETVVESSDERALGEVTQAAADFDMAGWLSGVRPVRKAVRVFLGDEVDALVELEKLADQIDRLPDGPEVDALIDRAEVLQEAARGQWVVVEAHSAERRKADEARLTDELGLDLKSDETKTEHGARLVAAMAAEQIVEPKISGEQLHELSRVRWPEAWKIINAASEVNSEPVSESKLVSVDFSRRRSGRR